MNLYPLIADRIERDPSVIDQALATAERWQEEGLAPPARMKAWREALQVAKESRDGMECLLRLLRDESESARRMKDFGPFAGILTREDRRKVFLACAYDH
jgi:hypothetical protein